MPSRAVWYKKGSIILFEVSDPLTIDDLETGAEEVWALATEIREPVDMIFDYVKVTDFPRGVLPIVREHFTLPTLDRVALVGGEPLIEMMIITLTRATFRPDPTIHATVEEAADALRRLAEDGNR
ncbi:MAG: hypothetical protein ABI947_26355 [Chloroflexota bacterium]